MYNLIDKGDGSIHKMNENEIRLFLKEVLEIDDAFKMDLTEVEQILHFQNYTMERE